MTLRRLLPGLLLGFVVFLAVALVGDLRQVGEEVRAFDWRMFPLAMALTLFNYALRGLKFHYYLRQVDERRLTRVERRTSFAVETPVETGVHDLPLRESFRLFVAGFPLAMTPGKVGEVFKAVWIEQKTGIPTARGVSVVVAERISDGLAVLLLSTVGVVAYPQYWPGFAFVLAALLGVIVVSQIRPLAYALLDLWARLPVVGRFGGTLRQFYEGSFALFRPSATLVGVGLGMVSWLGEGIGFYAILVGLGAPPGWEIFSIAVFILAFSTVVGAASALPGGLGAAEASIGGMLVLLGGLTSGAAAAATLLIRFATLWFGVALGLAAWVRSPDLFTAQGQKKPVTESTKFTE